MQNLKTGELLRTEGLNAGYEKKIVVQDVTIELKKGEILSLIGPNGAGKSTILKSIARELPALGGSIYLGQEELGSLKREELSKQLSILLTERIHTELMSCQEVVESGRYPYTGRFGLLSKEDHQKVEEAMELCRVTELRKEDFRRISDGQRQRVMLARAISQEPEILVLDEPTSFLDIRYKLEFLSLLRKLCEAKGISVIMSLHEVELAKKISDQVLAIKEGRVDRYGSCSEVFTEGYISELFSISEELYQEFYRN